jgi:hypothetical protein
MIRKILAILVTTTAAISLAISPAQATGTIYTFSATNPASNGGLATAQVCAVKVAINSVRLCETDRPAEGNWISWDTGTDSGGKFKMNALCLDYEDFPNHYIQWHCIGGSSTTLDDVATSGTAGTTDSPAVIFSTGDFPAFRIRFYGVGTGSIQNRYDSYQRI